MHVKDSTMKKVTIIRKEDTEIAAKKILIKNHLQKLRDMYAMKNQIQSQGQFDLFVQEIERLLEL